MIPANCSIDARHAELRSHLPQSPGECDDQTYLIRVRDAAVFTNWISLRRRINSLNTDKDVIVDLSEALLVDHTVMEKLTELEREFRQRQRRLEITGLGGHQSFSPHPQAARKKFVEQETV